MRSDSGHLAGCCLYDILDPYELAPKVGLCALDGQDALRLLTPDLQAHGVVMPLIIGREGSWKSHCQMADSYAF
jgi:hypothetical protein